MPTNALTTSPLLSVLPGLAGPAATVSAAPVSAVTGSLNFAELLPADTAAAHSATSAAADAAPPQVREMEALFISLMLKNLRQSESGEGLFPGDRSDTFGGMFDTYMGQHLADGGGIGLTTLFRGHPTLSGNSPVGQHHSPGSLTTSSPGTDRHALAVQAYSTMLPQ